MQTIIAIACIFQNFKPVLNHLKKVVETVVSDCYIALNNGACIFSACLWRIAPRVEFPEIGK
jgi:hypothetical protein